MNHPGSRFPNGHYPSAALPMNTSPSLFGPPPSSTAHYQIHQPSTPQPLNLSTAMSPPPPSPAYPPTSNSPVLNQQQQHQHPPYRCPTFNANIVHYYQPNHQITKYMYHYTDETGYQSIWANRKILASVSGTYGPGVYMTELAPSSWTLYLMNNNYGTLPTCDYKSLVGRTEYAFQFRSGDLRDLQAFNIGRNIYLYPWEYIDLDKCPFIAYIRSVKDYVYNEMNAVEVVGHSQLSFDDVPEGSVF